MSADTDSILGLALSISKKAQLVSDAFTASNTQPPSIHDGREPSWPVQLGEVRATLLTDMAKLQQLIADPRETLMDAIQPELCALNVIFHFGIARAVPLDDAVEYSVVAAATGLPEPELRRVLKLAMMRRIFREVEDGKIAHTTASRMLATDQDMIDWADVSYREILPAKLKTSHALRAFPGSDKASESVRSYLTKQNQAFDFYSQGFAFANAHLDMFSYFQTNPDRAKAFASGMNAVHKRGGFELEFLVDNMPSRKELKRGSTCVDIGGGNGATMLALAQAVPGARCIVQDLSSMIGSHIKIPDALEAHVEFVVHDFFTEQPEKGACVYLLRNVLHNWPDDKCLDILKRTGDAMSETSRILINDWCLVDEEDNTNPATAKKKREMDINMLSLLNSRERSVAEWQKLIENSGRHLVMESVVHPRGSNYSLISVRRRKSYAN